MVEEQDLGRRQPWECQGIPSKTMPPVTCFLQPDAKSYFRHLPQQCPHNMKLLVVLWQWLSQSFCRSMTGFISWGPGLEHRSTFEVQNHTRYVCAYMISHVCFCLSSGLSSYAVFNHVDSILIALSSPYQLPKASLPNTIVILSCHISASQNGGLNFNTCCHGDTWP